MDDNVPALLTATKAAKILGVHPVTVSRWANAGVLPFVTVPPYDQRMYQRQVITEIADKRNGRSQ